MKNAMLLFLFTSLWILTPKEVHAFKPAMHAKTANVAIFDALNGSICLPGLGGEVPLGDTELQHFVTFEEDGETRVEYRNYLLQYAPIIRAGSVGPDAFPDPLTGQMFTHENHAIPNTPESSMDNVHNGKESGFFASSLDFGSTELPELFGEGAQGTLDSLKATFLGQPDWRSIDWGHEILWAAKTTYQPQIDYWSSEEAPSPDMAEWWAENEVIRRVRARGFEEEQRAAVAFALGYLMHMAGDGQVHTMINEVVGLPWGYFDSRRKEDPYYGLLGSMTEELQHMAIESYLNSNYFPGSEPLSQRQYVDGSSCAGIAPLEASVACLEDDVLIEYPVPCDRCNPLRGADPRGLNNRCSHCFEYCDPWQELCPPTLPEPDPRICPTSEVCDFGTTGNGRLTLDGIIEACAQNNQDPLEYRRCRNEAVTLCTNARMECLCEQSVEALHESGILPDPNADYLCTTTENDPSTAYAGRTVRVWSELYNEVNDVFTDPQLGNPNLEETVDEIRLRGCTTAPLNAGRIYDISDPPTDPVMVDIQFENDSGSISSMGSDIDLNNNGRPDLINQCILLNCQMYPHTCPWNALDRDVDEREYTDLRTCSDFESNPDLAETALGGVETSTCDGLGPGPTSFQPDARAVINGDPDAVEAFLNSTHIEVPKNFINQAFYLNRIYLDPNGDAAPGAPGSYSLGGYPVNSIHAITDALNLLHLYLSASIGDPWSMLQDLFPNSDVVRLLVGWFNVVDRVAGFAENVGDTLYNSPYLNITIKIFGRTIRFGIGKMLARPWYAIAALVRALGDPLGETIQQIAGALDDEISQRVSMLRGHLRDNWVEATSCSAQTMTDGAHRHYAIGKYKEYADRALEIVVRGDDTCERPSLVELVLTGSGFGFTDALFLHRQFGQLIDWVGCEAQKLVLGEWLDLAIKNPLEKMLEKASEKIFCDLLLGGNEDLTESSVDTLREHCPEIHQVLWNPQENLSEELGVQALLEALNFRVTTNSGTTYNVREFVIRMRVVSTGTCWDGSLGTHQMNERDQLRAAFYDQALINEQCADELSDFSLDGFEPPEGVRSSSEIVDAMDAWIGIADSVPVTVRSVDRESGELVSQQKSIINSAKFESTYNAITLNKLALMGSGQTKGSSAVGQRSGIRNLITLANDVEQLGSGRPSFRSDEEIYSSERLSKNTNTELEIFFSEQFITASADPPGPGKRRCKDIGYNLLCNSIYSLDDPDDYCRQARAWVAEEEERAEEEEEATTNACLYRQNDHDPCLWLDGADSDYFPDPREGNLVCDTHGEYTREAHDHARDSTLHQRAFTLDTSRRAFINDGDHSAYGYALTRFSLANKDSHVSRLYSKVFSPFYCPLAGPAQADQDCDGVPDLCDNCPQAYNPAQVRSETRVEGDVCANLPHLIDSRCLAPLDPPVCEDCEEIGDIDLGLEPSGGGCDCRTTNEGNPAGTLLLIFVLVIFKRGRKRLTES